MPPKKKSRRGGDTRRKPLDGKNPKAAVGARNWRKSGRDWEDDVDDEEDEDTAHSAGRQYFPRRRNEAYPRHLTVNFQKFELSSLKRYISYYGIRVRPDASHAELATGVAQHFDSCLAVQDEDETISSFVQSYKQQKNKKGRKRGREGGGGGSMRRDHHQEDRILDRGDKVAAKLNQDDPWILASIVKYIPQKDKYQVEDEDSGDEGDGNNRRHRRRHTVNAAHVVPLSKANSPDCDTFQALDRVMAVYPNTTSFYPCTVVFGPRQVGTGQSKNTSRVVVKFDDDEDETGSIPEHRIPRRYVLPLPRI